MYKFDADKLILYTENENQYHSYFDLPAVISLAGFYYMWCKNGIMYRDSNYGSPYLYSEDIKKLQMIMDKEGNITNIHMENFVSMKFKYNKPHGRLVFSYSSTYMGPKGGAISKINIMDGIFSNGNKIGKWQYGRNTFYIDGDHSKPLDSYNGKVYEYHDNLKMRSETDYVDGKIQGKCIIWNTNDIKTSETDYVDDKKHGTCIIWSDDGIKTSETNYANNIRHGKYSIWCKDGTMDSYGENVTGHQHTNIRCPKKKTCGC